MARWRSCLSAALILSIWLLGVVSPLSPRGTPLAQAGWEIYLPVVFRGYRPLGQVTFLGMGRGSS